ncbi:glutamate dehydrogenase [Streptomyces sp. C]|nr:glutamate dehydrogenase [Streptomyces sp. C]
MADRFLGPVKTECAGQSGRAGRRGAARRPGHPRRRVTFRPADRCLPGGAWLTTAAEVLVPAAVSYCVGPAEQARISARYVVEAANLPCCPRPNVSWRHAGSRSSPTSSPTPVRTPDGGGPSSGTSALTRKRRSPRSVRRSRGSSRSSWTRARPTARHPAPRRAPWPGTTWQRWARSTAPTPEGPPASRVPSPAQGRQGGVGVPSGSRPYGHSLWRALGSWARRTRALVMRCLATRRAKASGTSRFVAAPRTRRRWTRAWVLPWSATWRGSRCRASPRTLPASRPGRTGRWWCRGRRPGEPGRRRRASPRPRPARARLWHRITVAATTALRGTAGSRAYAG